MSKEFKVSVTLYDGSTLFVDSIEEAVEEAKNKCWKSKKVSSITVRNPETGEEQRIEMA